ncbi:helix-turn-helix domain-containing protein [Clostridium beijerinckii]|uniref:helix-turn-helix domain-containing protein n=1 Tax=Clostridium beijerinckii TaxID=1520 RepID=UPI00047A5628|nr:helix-turn-helix transcriptional regulator [Clostridium beijerinckii]
MFGENIKKIRESKKIGVNELSRLSGVNASYISALERDEKKNPSVMILNKLATALDIAVDDIMKSETNTVEECSNIHEESDTYETEEFKTAEAAMKFILKQPAIMGFGGFDANKLSNEEIVQFANELLSQLQLLGLKYKK